MQTSVRVFDGQIKRHEAEFGRLSELNELCPSPDRQTQLDILDLQIRDADEGFWTAIATSNEESLLQLDRLTWNLTNDEGGDEAAAICAQVAEALRKGESARCWLLPLRRAVEICQHNNCWGAEMRVIFMGLTTPRLVVDNAH
jgi:hypothetical protein